MTDPKAPRYPGDTEAARLMAPEPMAVADLDAWIRVAGVSVSITPRVSLYPPQRGWTVEASTGGRLVGVGQARHLDDATAACVRQWARWAQECAEQAAAIGHAPECPGERRDDFCHACGWDADAQGAA